MVTATSGTLRIKQPAKVKAVTTRPSPADPAASRPAVNQADEVMGELVEVDLDEIQPSPDNPREYFDVDELRDLADSICRLGLLQPLLVGRCGGIFELIAGERRWRSCQIANKKKAACYVRDMSPEEVTLARWEENKKRSDLSVIEEARSYAKAIERHGWTQSELGQKLGLSASEVSNRLRLLRLPEAWQRRIISREMHKRQGLDIVQFADLPTFFAALESKWEEYLSERDPEDDTGISPVTKIVDMPAADWDSVVARAVYESSYSLRDSLHVETHYYRSVDLSDSPADVLRELNAREITSPEGRETRCFNVDLWEKLARQKYRAEKAEQEKKQAKKDAKKDGKNKGDAKPEPKVQTAEDRKKLAELHNKRIYRHRVAYLQKQIAGRVDQLEQEDMLVLMIGFLITHGYGALQRLEDAAKSLGIPGPKGSSNSVQWAWLLGWDRKKLQQILHAFFGQWCTLPARSFSSDADPVAIEAVAGILGIDLSKWSPDEEFLKLHTIEQLSELCKEWGLTIQSSGKAETIKSILMTGLRRKLSAPKELLKVTPCHLD